MQGLQQTSPPLIGLTVNVTEATVKDLKQVAEGLKGERGLSCSELAASLSMHRASTAATACDRMSDVSGIASGGNAIGGGLKDIGLGVGVGL